MYETSKNLKDKVPDTFKIYSISSVDLHSFLLQLKGTG